jgi:uncharacterized protein (DUF1330 family)
VAAYLVVDTDWKDVESEARTAFGQVATPVIQRYGGKFLTNRGQSAQPMEGDWNPSVLTIAEFPDAERIRQMWNDPDYIAAVAIRKATPAEFKVVVVDGASSPD